VRPPSLDTSRAVFRDVSWFPTGWLFQGRTGEFSAYAGPNEPARRRPWFGNDFEHHPDNYTHCVDRRASGDTLPCARDIIELPFGRPEAAFETTRLADWAMKLIQELRANSLGSLADVDITKGPEDTTARPA
jgi:hypothetical protein